MLSPQNHARRSVAIGAKKVAPIAAAVDESEFELAANYFRELAGESFCCIAMSRARGQEFSRRLHPRPFNAAHLQIA